MSNLKWTLAASFADRPSADAAVRRLQAAHLPCNVEAVDAVAGLPPAFNVLVPRPLVGLAGEALDPQSSTAAAFAALDLPRRRARRAPPSLPRRALHALLLAIIGVGASGAIYFRVSGTSPVGLLQRIAPASPAGRAGSRAAPPASPGQAGRVR